MAFDFSRLKGRIVEKYGSQMNFASAFGISNNTFSMKMNNKVRFSSDDIVRMADLLDISTEDFGSYFFNTKV